MRTWSRTSSRTSVRTFDRTESGALPVVSDPYFEYTTLLLPGNGTNGAQNNTFLDSSSNNFTITRNGNTTQGTFSPFSQTGWSNYFDGTGDYLRVADNAAFTLGSGNFTIECWIYNGTTAARKFIAGQSNSSGQNSSTSFSLQKTSGNKLSGSVCSGSSSYDAISSADLPLNQWLHVAFVRDGNTAKLFINGTQDGTIDVTGVTANDSSNQLAIAALGEFTGDTWNGYISNFRLVKGTAVYTTNFTPPTAPLTAITNTSLLTCQSNRFIDNSSNNFALTTNDNTSVQAFSPFNPTAAWSAATNGGSGYFDVSGDYLSVADNAALEMGSSNFTIECWFYPLSLPSDALIADFGSQGAQGSLIPFYCSSSNVVYYISSGGGTWNIASGVSFGGTLRIGQWHHLALVRNGNTYTPYFNGVAGTTTTNSSAINDAAVNKFIGSATTGTAAINGYLSDFRVVKGTAVYTANFTPPTAPLTAITNTSLLCSFTNAGIYDATSKNDLETVGNAQISTAQSQFGGSSMSFDGNGDYLFAPSNQLLAFGTADFTIEFWVYFNAVNTIQVILDFRPNATASSASPDLYLNSDGTLRWFISGSDRITSGALSASTWYHVAICRAASQTKLFINGTQSGSTYADTTSYLQAGAAFGLNRNNGGSAFYYLNAYINDLRISNGYARYTANFTPPTAAFPVL